MDAFPSNSHNPQAPPVKKTVEKVVTGEVVKKAKPLGTRFKEIFFGGDFRAATRYIAADVMLPALRNLIVDATTKGIESIIYGSERISRNRPADYRPRVRYDNPAVIRVDPRGRSVVLPDQAPFHPNRAPKRESSLLVLETRADAEAVLESLIDIINQYEVASVADLNELVGLPSSHVDNKWGWDKVTGFAVEQTRDGYVVDLPPAQPIQ